MSYIILVDACTGLMGDPYRCITVHENLLMQMYHSTCIPMCDSHPYVSYMILIDVLGNLKPTIHKPADKLNVEKPAHKSNVKKPGNKDVANLDAIADGACHCGTPGCERHPYCRFSKKCCRLRSNDECNLEYVNLLLNSNCSICCQNQDKTIHKQMSNKYETAELVHRIIRITFVFLF